ncbi:MAG TPA: pyridoxamine 5'-phosphate oxidase family protein [Baekduia sp.]|uniref:pyridoxamine 5'-phosphate oxidase family protein n=1 Tax=Baekduia sp. TaxID=2600305 RepID=UPI002D780842|nr:pyridoxamine 5'-phosphate oxidase family protein [Baekduia sp.]HET6510241.1 pyridoxamine 5'-phosphate oxidase family protein [Baekduia sp.]
MPSFSAFEAAAPELAAAVRARLTAHTHLTLATLRADGAPRVSGTECTFADGELWIGSMWQALKAHDLRRDPRYALHSGSDDPPAWTGDAKVAGTVEEVTDPELVERLNGEAAQGGPSHLFRLDVAEASTVQVDEVAKRLIVEVWTPERGVRRIERT